MILYQVSLQIPSDIHEEFVNWLRKEHLPKVMATGCFLESHIYRPQTDHKDGDSFLYTIQYHSRDLHDFRMYQEKYMEDLQNETKEKYGDKIKTERKVLEKVQLLNIESK